MTEETLIFVALGSNIDPGINIPRGLEELRQIPATRVVEVSSWYRTAPWGIADQPEFVNLVVALVSRLSARDLLRETQAIEERLARRRTQRNGPRTIDLDILLYGDGVLDEDDLKIPHPGLTERDFMLIPLIELAPDAVHPVRGRPVSELAAEVRYRQIIARLPAAATPQGGKTRSG